jgi:hypothetical protein
MILGMKWIKKFNPQVDWEGETLRFNSKKTNLRREPQVQKITQMAVNVTMSHSQHLDPEHEKLAEMPPKTLEQLVPQYLLPYKEVFLQGTQSRKTLPMSQLFDHKIELKEGLIPRNCKIYLLNPKETERMKVFIKENLANRFIELSKSPQVSPFFFVRKTRSG